MAKLTLEDKRKIADWQKQITQFEKQQRAEASRHNVMGASPSQFWGNEAQNLKAAIKDLKWLRRNNQL